MTFRKAARVVAAVGVFAASTFLATATSAEHVVSFTECSSASPVAPQPTFTPPPVEGEQTPPPQPESTPSPQNCMPAEGERIWGSRSLRFEVDPNSSRVRTVTLSILSQEENVPSASEGKPLATWTPTESQTQFTFDWNSFEATPYNGIYKVVVRAEATRFTSQRHSHTAERTDLRVDNAPRPVAPPKILAATLESVTLEWQRAVEPDVTAYTVFRATTESKNVRPDYASFKQIGITTSPAYRDTGVQPGTHWYVVRVTRRSVVTPDQGISSPLSQMSSPAQVDSPTKTPGPKAKPGGGGGGGDNDDAEPEERYIPYRQLAPARPRAVARAVPDAPFAYKLPYDDEPLDADFGAVEEGSTEGPTDPRGAVLPVAVGMFLVSSALAVGRMPY